MRADHPHRRRFQKIAGVAAAAVRLEPTPAPDHDESITVRMGDGDASSLPLMRLERRGGGLVAAGDPT